MKIISLLLSPLVEAMRLVLVAFHAVTGSYGVSIVLLSLLVRILTAPLLAMARRAEEREGVVQSALQPELIEIRRTSKGRERFERMEELYNRHGYHPIQSVTSILPLFLQIPFLLAALFLLSDYPPLVGQQFLLIPDLLQPDQLASLPGFGHINILPILIVVVSLTESLIKVGSTSSSRMRFLIVALVIAMLIYPAPAGVCLYWLTSTIWSLAFAAYERMRNAAEATR